MAIRYGILILQQIVKQGSYTMALASNASAPPCAKPFHLGQLSAETLAVWRECSVGLCYYMTSPIFRLMDVMKSLVGGTFAELGIKGGEGNPHW